VTSPKYGAYPNRRGSGIGWLGKIPSHWNTKRVGHLFYESNARAVSVIEKKLPVLSVSIHHGISDKELDEVELERKVSRSEDRSLYKIIQENDLSYNMMRAWQGGFGAAKISGLISPAYVVCRPRFGASSEYFELLLRTPNAISEVKRFSRGITDFRLRLYWEDFKAVEVPVPPDAEQQSILKFLDYETAKIDALIEKQQQLIALLKEKRQAVISHAVTKGLNPDAPMRDSGIEWLGEVPAHWYLKPIKWAAMRLQTGSTPPTEHDRFYCSGTVPWFGPSSFGEPIMIGEPVKFINECAITEGKARRFSKGTILVVGIGATIGKSALTNIQCSANQQVTALEFSPNELLPEFAAFSIRRLEAVFRNLAQYTTIPIMNQSEIGIYELAIPSLDEQKAIVSHLMEKLAAFDQVTDRASELMDLLQERRTALISAAVTGKIDVRDWKPPLSETELETETA